MSKTPLSTEELLKPRYVVSEEGYPDMIFQPKQIITLHKIDTETGQPYWVSPKKNHWYAPFFNRFPSIFRPMPWYEGREVGEMPEYLKWGRIVLKNPSYNHSGFYAEGVGWINFKNNEVSPSNATEYESYINSKQ